MKVWRYMDLPKLLDLLIRKQLFLSRLDLLGDSHEGSLSRGAYEKKKEALNFLGVKYNDSFETENAQRLNRSMFVNCWYYNSHESEAMWRLYCPNNEGVALQTTYSKLVKSIESNDALLIGQVQYIDYETEWFPSGNIYYPIMHKRKAFEHENEIRIVKSHSDYWDRELEKDKSQKGFIRIGELTR